MRTSIVRPPGAPGARLNQRPLRWALPNMATPCPSGPRFRCSLEPALVYLSCHDFTTAQYPCTARRIALDDEGAIQTGQRPPAFATTFPGYARISSTSERLMKRSQLWRKEADIDSSKATTSTLTP